MNKIRLILVLSLFLFLGPLVAESRATSVLASDKAMSSLLANKGKKQAKVETITSKKALIKSLEKHLVKFDAKISYKISKKVVKNFESFDKVFWSEDNKNFLSTMMLSKVDSFDYWYEDTKSYFYIKLDIKYKGGKKELKAFLSEMKEDEKAPILSTEKDVREAFFENYHSLNKNYILKLSKEIAKKYKNNLELFLKSLEDDPRYNDLSEKLLVYGGTVKTSKYTVFQFSTDREASESKIQKIIEKMTPVLNTKEEVFAQVIANAEKLQNRYSINIKNDALPYDVMEDDQFWDELYRFPEFNDLSHYNEDGSYYVERFKGYYRLTISDKYTVQNTELDNLKNFVKSWVSTNIRDTMTEEEKARAINDFMVKEYRYTYGDRGQLFGKEEGEEKLGKYSVYTCFALIDGKGGVCDAKAKMFYRLAKEAGLEVIYITGSVKTGLHAWNMVKVDGVWYHLDNTWNRGHYEGTSEYEYFNNRDYYLKGDATMRKDHSWDESKYPVAPMDYQGYVPSASIVFPILNKVA